MTVAMPLDSPGSTPKQYVTAWPIMDANQPEGSMIRSFRSITERWRDLEAWEAPDAIEAFIRSVAQFLAVSAEGEPTWEDAAWQ